MQYAIKCNQCGSITWIHGAYEGDVNAYVLDDNDYRWDEVCEHIKNGVDYEIVDSEYEDFEE